MSDRHTRKILPTHHSQCFTRTQGLVGLRRFRCLLSTTDRKRRKSGVWNPSRSSEVGKTFNGWDAEDGVKSSSGRSPPSDTVGVNTSPRLVLLCAGLAMRRSMGSGRGTGSAAAPSGFSSMSARYEKSFAKRVPWSPCQYNL